MSGVPVAAVQRLLASAEECATGPLRPLGWSELLDLDTQETLRWASSTEEASFSMAELEALTTQGCDDYAAETCEQATQQWRHLTPDQRRLYARRVRGLPELAAEQ